METTGMDRGRARALLDAADGNVKTALVMNGRDVAAEEARRLLAEADGRVARVVSLEESEGG